MGFSRQQYWSGLPFPSPGDLPDPGIEPGLLNCQADSLLPSRQRSPSRQEWHGKVTLSGKNRVWCLHWHQYIWRGWLSNQSFSSAPFSLKAQFCLICWDSAQTSPSKQIPLWLPSVTAFPCHGDIRIEKDFSHTTGQRLVCLWSNHSPFRAGPQITHLTGRAGEKGTRFRAKKQDG